jgi:hypothetical protein
MLFVVVYSYAWGFSLFSALSCTPPAAHASATRGFPPFNLPPSHITSSHFLSRPNPDDRSARMVLNLKEKRYQYKRFPFLFLFWKDYIIHTAELKTLVEQEIGRSIEQRRRNRIVWEMGGGTWMDGIAPAIQKKKTFFNRENGNWMQPEEREREPRCWMAECFTLIRSKDTHAKKKSWRMG